MVKFISICCLDVGKCTGNRLGVSGNTVWIVNGQVAIPCQGPKASTLSSHLQKNINKQTKHSYTQRNIVTTAGWTFTQYEELIFELCAAQPTLPGAENKQNNGNNQDLSENITITLLIQETLKYKVVLNGH